MINAIEQSLAASRANCLALLDLVLSIVTVKLGRANEPRIPTIETETISSIRVKPFGF